MKPTHFAAIVFLCSGTASLLIAQGVPYPATTLNLSGYDTRGSGVPAGTNTTALTFTVEADTTGNNVFEVATSDPGLVVSLLTPSGAMVNAANAASLGYSFTTIPDGTATPDALSALSLPGTHTLIQVPAGQPSGTYQITADATNVTTDSAIIATYYSSSNVRTAAITNAANYKIGDTVVLSALIFDGSTPVPGGNR